MPLYPPATAGGSALTVKDEGSNLDTAVTSIDFVGSGVSAAAVGHAITATISGGGGGGGGSGVSFSGAHVTNSGTTSLNNGSRTTITFDTEDYDTDSYHSTSSNQSRLTIPATGKYRVTGSMKSSAGGTSEFDVLIRLNAASDLAWSTVTGGGSIQLGTPVVWEGALTAGDYVELQAFIDAAGRTASLQSFSIQRLSDGGAMTLIEDVVLGSDTASFDFTSIPGTYKHLKVIISGRSTRASNDVDLVEMRFNNDSSSVYSTFFTQVFQGSNSGSFSENVNQNAFKLALIVPAATSPTDWHGGGEILIPNYAAAYMKWFSEDGFTPTADASTGFRVTQTGGNWKSTAAITRVTIYPTNGNWKTGSRASLYGIS